MSGRYPGYDVTRKWDSPSWNDQTRKVVGERMAISPHQRKFFSLDEWAVLVPVCARIVPQSAGSSPAPVAAMIDRKMAENAGDGYRHADMPPMQEAWRRGLAGVETLARERFSAPFSTLSPERQDEALKAVQEGKASGGEWGGMSSAKFFKERVLPDVLSAFYALPDSWSAIGFGGPAAPRGYVRMNFDSRDPWEAAEAKPGAESEARRANRRV